MYASVTGLKTKGFMPLIRFWMLAVPAFRAAKKADGCIVCETKVLNGYHHTFTVWKDKTSMMNYRVSPVHLKAMKVFSKIAHGKVYGYETNSIPTWKDAVKRFNEFSRDV